MSVLVVIPARGGSKGVPRKNLRPLLGKPLIAYSIVAALEAKSISRVVVSTEDKEIAMFAERFGAEVIMRPAELAEDHITLDPVVQHAVCEAEKRWDECYDIVVTVQATSPLLCAEDLENVVALFDESAVETVISATDDRHLRWQERQGRILPLYEKRVNRQDLPATYRETGAIIACRRELLKRNMRIGDNVKLYLVSPERSVDIDTVSGFHLCEMLLNRRRIVFAVVGCNSSGLDHVQRMVIIAHELLSHELIFVCEEKDDLAINYIKQCNYCLDVAPNGKLLETIISLKPHMVINDLQDTTVDYMMVLKKAGIVAVNFEDMGPGAQYAELVINALYSPQIPGRNVLTGPKYFCLMDEFFYLPKQRPIESVERVLITFGGVDEGSLTTRLLSLIGIELVGQQIGIDIILEPGYRYREELDHLVRENDNELIRIINSTFTISEYMSQADLAITSGGRRILELAALGIPTIVISQNHRQTTNKYISAELGIINLGLRHNVKDDDIVRIVKRTIADRELRATMREKAEKMDLTKGRLRVMRKINSIIEEIQET